MTPADYDKSVIILKQAYQHFNKREIDATLNFMHPGVDWPNGMTGGYEKGTDAVRNYWTRQWEVLDPHVEPLSFELEDDGRIKVTVHQVVHEVSGTLLIDEVIHHVYMIDGGLIRSMEIKN